MAGMFAHVKTWHRWPLGDAISDAVAPCCGQLFSKLNRTSQDGFTTTESWINCEGGSDEQ